MVFLTRRERFNAAHRLFNENLSEAENFNVFGKCANKNFHGHNYDLYVTVVGKPDPQTGFVINAHELSHLIREYIIEKLDHKNLNLDVDFMQGIFPSSENLAIKIWEQLAPLIKHARLHAIKLVETENIYVEYFGKK
ncbi:MAG: 6-carboxytetrahydropterin synthase [Chitinophagales bacterium]|nr:6-carboxytetrahydropterin synthase [Bacteroidota bacterium]MCB9042635.1 6-carboxytetrahydropterin synthase [Chitinophagales bacterium]